MDSFVQKLTKLDNGLAKGEGWALICSVVVMAIVVLLQVIYRYLLTQPLYWSEELARYLFIWISILGAALSVHRRGHFGMDFFFKMLPGRWRRGFTFLIILLMGIVVMVLLVQGIYLVRKTVDQQSPAMEISMAWAYASLPVGAALMTIHLLVIVMKEARGEPGINIEYRISNKEPQNIEAEKKTS